ncbi:hypothetical protein KAW18_16110 [candidate division WOR-3 bacterium]|nr:hypothetical protein [candidate division WOR-3 bacterium]
MAPIGKAEVKGEGRDMVADMEALKADKDLIDLDGQFADYILDQTNYVKTKVMLIENLVENFREKTGKIPAGMIPSHDLIDEFSKAINYLEKAQTRLSIELVRLKSMQMVQERMVNPMGDIPSEKPPEDVSFC